MFRQLANGSVELKVVPGGDHCGIDDNSLTVNYEIELQFRDDEKALDEHGFLLDNTAFRGYFTGMSTVAINISCERLAKKVAHDLAAMLGRDRALASIRVKLSPFQGVAVEYTLAVPAMVPAVSEGV